VTKRGGGVLRDSRDRSGKRSRSHVVRQKTAEALAPSNGRSREGGTRRPCIGRVTRVRKVFGNALVGLESPGRGRRLGGEQAVFKKKGSITSWSEVGNHAGSRREREVGGLEGREKHRVLAKGKSPGYGL